MTVIAYLVLSFFNACALFSVTLLISALFRNTQALLIALVAGGLTFVISFIALACCRMADGPQR